MKYTIGYKMSKKATNPLSKPSPNAGEDNYEAMAKEMYTPSKFCNVHGL